MMVSFYRWLGSGLCALARAKALFKTLLKLSGIDICVYLLIQKTLKK
jgi:hypothetical protein